MNIVMNDQGGFIEVQGTAEGVAFSDDELEFCRMAHVALFGMVDISSLLEHLLQRLRTNGTARAGHRSPR